MCMCTCTAVASAVFQGGVFGIVGRFPQKYRQAVMSGQVRFYLAGVYLSLCLGWRCADICIPCACVCV